VEGVRLDSNSYRFQT